MPWGPRTVTGERTGVFSQLFISDGANLHNALDLWLRQSDVAGTFDQTSDFPASQAALYAWIQQLLPVEESKLAEKRSYEGMGEGAEVGETDQSRDYIFEPDTEGVLDRLLPLYLNYQVYQMILEARVSEHSARMVAMKAATDNAEQMIKDLTLEYNKVRQAAITSELLEITTAMKAME